MSRDPVRSVGLLTVHRDVDVVEADVGAEAGLHALRREGAVERVDLHRARLPVRAGGANCRQKREAVVQVHHTSANRASRAPSK